MSDDYGSRDITAVQAVKDWALFEGTRVIVAALVALFAAGMAYTLKASGREG